MKTSIALFAVAISLSLSACSQDQRPTTKETESDKAATAANSIRFTENAEIANIKKRLELTADPGLLGFIVILNQTGQPVMATAVKGKVTSGGKRLTPADRLYSDYQGYGVRQAASDEGTYGQSGEYIYFWTPSDQYIQTNQGYVYSDKPIRLKIEPLVIADAAPSTAIAPSK